jgi:hypothetical protein
MAACEKDVFCIRNSGFPEYDDNYYISTTQYNGNSYYTGLTNGFFIYFNSGITSWCFSTTLGGDCILMGKSPCLSDCPDLSDTFFNNGFCPTPTPTPTANCSNLDFDAVFECEITMTPTQTPSLTPTNTLTPSVTQTVYCPIGIDATINAYTPTRTPTPTMTPSTAGQLGNYCSFSGNVTFTTVDSVIECNFSKQFQDCYNGEYYYTNSSVITPSGGSISQYMIFQAIVDGVSSCISYVGENQNVSGINNITLTTEVIGYSNLGDCSKCLAVLTPTPTQTPTVTPTIPLTSTPTPTPTVTQTSNNPTPTPTRTPTKTQTPSMSPVTIWYTFKICGKNNYIVQSVVPPIITNPTIGQVIKGLNGECYELINITTVLPVIAQFPPAASVIFNGSNNYFTATYSNLFTSCLSCANNNPASNSPTPTRTPTKTPTPTPTKTMTPTPSKTSKAVAPSQCGCIALRNSIPFPTTAYYTDCNGNPAQITVPSGAGVAGTACICYTIGTPITGAVSTEACDGVVSGGGSGASTTVYNNCLNRIASCS